MTNQERDILTASMRANNLHTWLELEALKAGTSNQRERYMAGVLPEDELTFLAREELFKGFAELKRSAKRDRREGLTFKVPHSRECQGGAWDYETADVLELEADEWTNLKHIQAVALTTQGHEWLVRSGGTVTIKSSTHWATCQSCKAEACRSSAKVTIEWADRLLTREYVI